MINTKAPIELCSIGVTLTLEFFRWRISVASTKQSR